MRQIITVDQFSPAVLMLAGALFLAGALAGALGAGLRHDRRWLRRGLALGLLGPLLGLAWLAFRWSVRIDPAARYVGLYRPGVIAAAALAFLAAGAGLGLLFRWAWALKEEIDDGARDDSSV
jgi:hypothetical protein